MNAKDYTECAERIVQALRPQSGERAVLKLDPRLFGSLVEPLQVGLRRCGAVISGVILSEDTQADSEAEYDALQRLFATADIFIWLPEKLQKNRPALDRALTEWLEAGRGRAVHFHWQSGSFALPGLPLPEADVIDRLYLEALKVPPERLESMHLAAIPLLRRGTVRVTTPEGTDLEFVVENRPFCSQIGDASRDRMRQARTRIDRDIELPAGVLRVAPIEQSANGTLFLHDWAPVLSTGHDLLLRFQAGRLEEISGQNAAAVFSELDSAGGSSRMFREFALGFNPVLRIRPESLFIGYYGYGAGVVRLSLGDNAEMGGLNRGGGVYWNFIHNATVHAGGKLLADNGNLVDIRGRL